MQKRAVLQIPTLTGFPLETDTLDICVSPDEEPFIQNLVKNVG
jgi:hypothetical protein